MAVEAELLGCTPALWLTSGCTQYMFGSTIDHYENMLGYGVHMH